jgi:hypothetical protein
MDPKIKRGCLITISAIVVILVLMAWLGNTEFVQWDNAQRKNSIQTYEKYLADHPQGSHAAEARARLQELRPQRDMDWNRIESAEPSELEGLLPTYLDKYSNGSAAVEYFRKNRQEYIESLRSVDPVTRANYAGYAADRGARGVLFTPYLIDLLEDNTRLQILSGAPVGPKSKVGETTVSDCARNALTKIHREEMSTSIWETPTEEAKTLAKDKKAWQKWWAEWWIKNREQFR